MGSLRISPAEIELILIFGSSALLMTGKILCPRFIVPSLAFCSSEIGMSKADGS
jgi:hypothetical protein